MKSLIALFAVAIALSACGGRVTLKPKAGNAFPMKAETAQAVPTVDQLIMPDTQARPKRSDEQLKRSEQRREDKFDLPPT